MHLPSVVVTVEVGDFTLAGAWVFPVVVPWDSTAAPWEGFIPAAGTKGTGISMVVIMAFLMAVGADTTDTMLATDGMADIGGIHTTAGAGVLAGRIGVGDGDMATTVTIPGILPPTFTTLTPIIVHPAIHVLPMGTTPRLQPTPVRSPGVPPQNLKDLTRVPLTRMTGVATPRPRRMVRLSQLREQWYW
jgi:hypothetical protein